MRRNLVVACVLSIGFSTVAAATTPQTTAPGETGMALARGALEALERDDLAEAERLFRQLAAHDATSPDPWLGLSLIEERRGDLVAALVAADRAVGLTPSSAGAWRRSGELRARLGDVAGAQRAYAELRAIEPSAVDAYLVPAVLLRDADEMEAAVALLEAAAENGVASRETAVQLGLLHLKAGQAERAERVARAGLEEYPADPELELVFGLALAALPATRAAAIEPLNRALEAGVLDAGTARLELAELLTEANRPQEAVDQLRLALAALPETAELLYRLGTAERAAGDLEAARATLTRYQALQRASDEREAAEKQLGIDINEAQTLATENRLGEALQKTALLAETYPAEPRVVILHSKLLYSLGRSDEALVEMRRARDLAPARVEPHFLEGRFLLEAGKPAAAQDALRRAAALAPGLGETWLLLGSAAAKQRRPEDAARYFVRALELGVDTPALRLGYAAALESLGRDAESERQMAEYRRLKAVTGTKP